MVQCVCQQCWFVFEARRSSAKFCSPACKQKAHRIKNGQRFENKVKTVNERCMCRHCGAGFWQSGKGRKAHYCSNSCRQLANVAKKHAGFRYYKRMGNASDYAAWTAVETLGTDGVDELAAAAGYHYSYVQRMYIKTEAYFSLDPMNFGIVSAK